MSIPKKKPMSWMRGGGGDKKKPEAKRDFTTSKNKSYEAPERELSSKYSPYAKPSNQERIVDVKKRDVKSAGKSIKKRTNTSFQVKKKKAKGVGRSCKAVGKAAKSQFKGQ